jgi:hypothetical protein
MAKVGAQRAAALTGKSKSTIQRAMKSGKISYELDHNGRRVIDVAELERAFGLVPQSSEGNVTVEDELKKAAEMLEIERLKMKVKMLEEQLEFTKEQLNDLKEQRDQWQKQAQQVLITSQYSQKQAEELKAEMKERERRARLRRAQTAEQKVKSVKSNNTKPLAAKTLSSVKADKSSFDIQGLWHKIRGQEEKEQEEKEKLSA